VRKEERRQKHERDKLRKKYGEAPWYEKKSAYI
jgi:hypothetical protein